MSAKVKVRIKLVATMMLMPLVALIGAWEKEKLGERLPKLLFQLTRVLIELFVVVHLVKTLLERMM